MTTLREYLQVCGQDELLAQFQRIAPSSYDEFIGRLYLDLDELIGLIEADAKDFHNASEDELNRELVRLLIARHFVASHDHDEGGHVDVRVRSRCGKFSWLAEAKLDRGPAYLSGGVDQLTDRYVRGTPGHCCGGFLVYIQKDRCAERFATWQQHFTTNIKGFEELTVEPCTARSGFAFYSEFVHPRIGNGAPKYRIRHIAVTVFRPASAAP